MTENNHSPELLRNTKPISELLPRYYEVVGKNPKHTILDVMDIDGHEVAWMSIISEVDEYGNKYNTYALQCACDYTEGVGWDADEDKVIIYSEIPDNCPYKEAALLSRQAELRAEYIGEGVLDCSELCIEDSIEFIILDLMEKAKHHDFLEKSGAAKFWGGHFHLQTVAVVTEIPLNVILNVAEKMESEEKIRLNGVVVQSPESDREIQ